VDMSPVVGGCIRLLSSGKTLHASTWGSLEATETAVAPRYLLTEDFHIA
jgi:hypothetical protein